MLLLLKYARPRLAEAQFPTWRGMSIRIPESSKLNYNRQEPSKDQPCYNISLSLVLAVLKFLHFTLEHTSHSASASYIVRALLLRWLDTGPIFNKQRI